MKGMLKHLDPQVLINTVNAIHEISADEGGIKVDRDLVIVLLNRVRELNVWGQSLILDICS